MKISRAGKIVVINPCCQNFSLLVCQQVGKFGLDIAAKKKIRCDKSGAILQKHMKRGITIFIILEGRLALVDLMDFIENGRVHEFLGVAGQTMIAGHISIPPILSPQ